MHAYLQCRVLMVQGIHRERLGRNRFSIPCVDVQSLCEKMSIISNIPRMQLLGYLVLGSNIFSLKSLEEVVLF
jgi:hypothetical protein